MSTRPTTPATGSGKPKIRKERRTPVQRKRIAGGTISIQQRKVGKFVARVVVHVGEIRTTKGFETLEAAKAYAAKQEIEAQNAGTRAASTIGDKERRALLDGAESLKPYGKSVADAVAFYLAHLKASVKSSTVEQMIASLLASKVSGSKSPRHLSDLRSRLGRFSKDFGTRPIGGITHEEIDVWLAGLNLAPVGHNNSRRVVANLFNFAAERGYAPAGIMRKTARKKVSSEEPAILTVAQADALIRNAHPSIRAALVIGLFCGCREAEVGKLTWQSVDLEGEVVTIGASISKVNQRRTIRLHPNALAWLQPLRQTGGKIMPSGRAPLEHLQAARNAAGFGAPRHCTPQNNLTVWPSNALRHTYASYALAQWPDAAALALEMGNSPAVILRHYRSLVKPAAAAAFWNITPANRPEGKVADMPSAKTA
ncbi:MAG: site-specific integrase [Verrucomicrobiota bacterium]